MPISSYKVEWLIHQRRRWRGLVDMVERALSATPERIELSTEAREQAVGNRAPDSAGVNSNKIWPADIAEGEVYPQPVAYELERRAGSFMKPKYVPSNPPPPIPRVDLWDSVRQDEDDDEE